jgi:hypothetical protein
MLLSMLHTLHARARGECLARPAASHKLTPPGIDDFGGMIAEHLEDMEGLLAGGHTFSR